MLADVDWELIDAWAEPERATRRGYWLETVDGVFPERLRRDAAAFHRIMQTAPREDLDVGDVVVDEDFVAELDRALLEAGRTRWTVLVREPSGACVGGTEVTFDARDPNIVHQQNTGIDRAHRGLGLARWAKAATLRRIRAELPAAQRVRTENASSNAVMLAINEAIGFAPMSTRTEWQAIPGPFVPRSVAGGMGQVRQVVWSGGSAAADDREPVRGSSVSLPKAWRTSVSTPNRARNSGSRPVSMSTLSCVSSSRRQSSPSRTNIVISRRKIRSPMTERRVVRTQSSPNQTPGGCPLLGGSPLQVADVEREYPGVLERTGDGGQRTIDVFLAVEVARNA